MAETPSGRPLIDPGTERDAVPPSPSWPKEFWPQHSGAPLTFTAQVWLVPADRLATPLESPVTGVGTFRSPPAPAPSWPLPFAPQQNAAPAAVTAQVWLSPTAMAATPLARPKTAVGVVRCVHVASPSWPLPLYPQQRTAPAVVSAQVWNMPAAMDTTPLPRPETGVGVDRAKVVPSPSWPLPLYPQQTAPPPGVTAQVCWLPTTTFVAVPAAAARIPIPSSPIPTSAATSSFFMTPSGVELSGRA